MNFRRGPWRPVNPAEDRLVSARWLVTGTALAFGGVITAYIGANLTIPFMPVFVVGGLFTLIAGAAIVVAESQRR